MTLAPKTAVRKDLIDGSKRVVIKLGTAVLMNDQGGIALSRFYSFVEGIAQLIKSGKEVLLVTSGAVGLGARALGISSKPKLLPVKQACAAVGQGRLMALYNDAFEKMDVVAAQILLTEEDFSNRQRYLNLRSTINELLEHRVLPIFNENDAVSTAEIEMLTEGSGVKINFGDNDKLSSLVASKIEADLLLILTDVEGLYTADPRSGPDAKLISVVEQFTADIELLGESKGRRGQARARWYQNQIGRRQGRHPKWMRRDYRLGQNRQCHRPHLCRRGIGHAISPPRRTERQAALDRLCHHGQSIAGGQQRSQGSPARTQSQFAAGGGNSRQRPF